MERDPLGEIEVPADAYYGIQTVRAVENFPVSGLRPYRAFVWAFAVISLKHISRNNLVNLPTDSSSNNGF